MHSISVIACALTGLLGLVEHSRAQLPVPPPTETRDRPAASRAQSPAVGSAGQDAALREVSTYSPSMSWALFAACDANSDDRLDLLEATRGIVDLGGPRDLAAFRRLETNRDGYVEWTEFDARYRHLIEVSGRFRVRAARPVEEPRDPTLPGDEPEPVQQLIRLTDEDSDGALSAAEFGKFLGKARLDQKLVAHFARLDRDGSGTLDAAEFAPVMELEGIPLLLTPNRIDRDDLPPDYRLADHDLDGVIDLGELEAALRRIDPALSSFAKVIMAGADRSGNGSLGSTEILRVLKDRESPSNRPDPPIRPTAPQPTNRK